MLPLEDFFNDVVNKAQRGLGLSDEALAEKAGVEVAALQSVKSGEADATVLAKIAPVLNLHGPSLIAMAQKSWTPKPIEAEGLAQFNTPFDDMTVNAYLVWDDSTKLAAAFDTGASCEPILEALKEHGLKLGAIFLTHTHPDHVADLDRLRAETGHPPVYSHKREPWPDTSTFAIGNASHWEVGDLHVEARSTWGHSKGGITYVVDGISRPVAIVGDALFASSMGGGVISYADALETNRKEIFSLPGETVICPGHGPLTTVSEEKAHNPFYPEYK